MSEILTDEQIENWRRILIQMFGPYALLLSRDKIQVIRDIMQKRTDQLDPASKGENDVPKQNR